MMNEEQKDAYNHGIAMDRMNSLGAFDKNGIHADNWNNIRKATKLRTSGQKSVCGWPGCDDSKVVKSHTIARASGLGPIERNQHVLMPNFGNLPVEMTLRGRNNATTFPGYCTEHEQRFQVFEQDGVLKSMSDVALQLFRSTAREHSNKRQKYAYFHAVYEELMEVLIINPTEPVHSGLASEVLEPLENILKRISEEAMLLAALWKGCIDLTEFSDEPNANPIPRMIRRMHVETSRRVALSGSTFIDAMEPSRQEKYRIPVVITMLPTKTGVDLLFVTMQAAADQYETELHEVIAKDGGDALVDLWLVHADWWCADPDWWKSTELTWQKSILSQLGSV